MRKFSFLAALIVFAGVIAFGSSVSMADDIILDLSGVPVGQTIESNVVNPDIFVNALFGTARKIATGDVGTEAYNAPNVTTINGCLPDGMGFSDLDSVAADGAPNTHIYEFTLRDGVTATEVSLWMHDAGDYNPNQETSHMAKLTAFNGDAEVGSHTLSYNSDDAVNPGTSDFGDLWVTGDACDAKPGSEPGNYLFTVEGAGITRVLFEFPDGQDPKIAFSGLRFTTTTIGSFCGDGTVDDGEECDDGNIIGGDGCSANCTIEKCGNGIKDANEECDDGNDSNNDHCRNDCKRPVCGDGYVQPPEECDPGNFNDGPTALNDIPEVLCREDCTLPGCGDGIVDLGEECDDGNLNNYDLCRNNCTFPFCGDGIVDLGEECDDGNVQVFAIDGTKLDCCNHCTLYKLNRK